MIEQSRLAQIIGRWLSEPNRAFSSANEWRYGAKGSLSVNLVKGTWFDHEGGEGGGALDRRFYCWQAEG